jgi:hypothetical protein
VAWQQGDQTRRIFAYIWFTLGSLKKRLMQAKSYAFILTKTSLGATFLAIFCKRIWSPCLATGKKQLRFFAELKFNWRPRLPYVYLRF